MQIGVSPYIILNIYKRNNRINARIKEKADITKVLANISQETSQQFVDSIQNVNMFIEKVWILINGNKDLIGKLFAANNLNGGKTDQNFYLLWLMLQSYDTEFIASERELIFDKIHRIYFMGQNLEKDADYFVRLLKSV